MKIIYYGAPYCNKCIFLKQPAREYAEKNGYEFIYKDIEVDEIEHHITSIPTMFVDDKEYDYDGIVGLVSNHQ